METMILDNDYCDGDIRQYPKGGQYRQRISLSSKCGFVIGLFAILSTILTVVSMTLTLQVLRKLDAVDATLIKHIAELSEWKNIPGHQGIRPSGFSDPDNTDPTNVHADSSDIPSVHKEKCLTGAMFDSRMNGLYEMANATHVGVSIVTPLVQSVAQAAESETIFAGMKMIISNHTDDIHKNFTELFNDMKYLNKTVSLIQGSVDDIVVSSKQNGKTVQTQTEGISVRLDDLTYMLNETKSGVMVNTGLIAYIYKEDKEGKHHDVTRDIITDTIQEAITNSTVIINESYSSMVDKFAKTVVTNVKNTIGEVKYSLTNLNKAQMDAAKIEETLVKNISNISRDMRIGFNTIRGQLPPLIKNSAVMLGSIGKLLGQTSGISTQLDQHTALARYNFLSIMSRVTGINSSIPCYKAMRTTRVTWDEAKNKCKEEQGYLAEITDKRSLQYVKDVYYPGDHLWLGGTDKGSEGIWYWEHSKANMTVFDWKPGQPDNWRNGEHCMHTTSLGFNDVSCNGHLYFLCQRDDEQCGDWILK